VVDLDRLRLLSPRDGSLVNIELCVGFTGEGSHVVKGERSVKNALFGVLVLAMVTVLAGSAVGQDGTRLAVVDMVELVRSHPDTASADDLLEKQLEDFELEREELLQKGETLKDAYDNAMQEAANPALSREAQQEKEEEALRLRNTLKEFEREFLGKMRERQRQLTEQEGRLRRRIITSIRDVVAAYAAAEGIALVLDKSGASVSGVETVVFSSPRLDVTDAIREKLNAEAAAPARGEEEQE